MKMESATNHTKDNDNNIVRPIKVRSRKDTKDDGAALDLLVSRDHGSPLEDIANGGLNTEALKNCPEAILQVARALGRTLDDSRPYPWVVTMGAAQEMRRAAPDLRGYVDATAELLGGIKMNKRRANWAPGVAFVVTGLEELITCEDKDTLRSVNCNSEFDACIDAFRHTDYEFDEAIHTYLQGLMARRLGDLMSGAGYCLLACSWMEPDGSLFGTGIRTRKHLKDLALEWVEAADLSV